MNDLIDVAVVLVLLGIVGSLMHTIWVIRLRCVGIFRSKWMLAEAIYSWRTGDANDSGFMHRRSVMNSAWMIVRPLVFRWIVGTKATQMLSLCNDARLIAELQVISTECPALYATLYELHIDAHPELFKW